MVYKTKGVCAQEIQFEMDADHKIHNVQFFGGCSGNTQGVSALVEGMDADEVISRLEGIKCGFKNTSCPDQLTIAIKQALNKKCTLFQNSSPCGDLHCGGCCLIYSISFLSHLSHRDWTSREKRSRSLFGIPSFFLITDRRR